MCRYASVTSRALSETKILAINIGRFPVSRSHNRIAVEGWMNAKSERLIQEFKTWTSSTYVDS
ncbi:predicted protein [Sclerotinia sclerotiorum 1980 UF-70]|uniref:Uncharacterized protein n=1 Tax=Sclerotinia sclerotiorum (strain ATCC 18683 / 1980 / Ss-1) TaxID=665079 RepID=A7EGJ8_SCLS1|nr:predicted protein [Sclerotinia sclerotiorum 1980 UF-70]EDO01964.1 predicted protein [Sclerotinia sclerotiorum 1980 UF-70]